MWNNDETAHELCLKCSNFGTISRCYFVEFTFFGNAKGGENGEIALFIQANF